jgi:micrococcal nuclease
MAIANGRSCVAAIAAAVFLSLFAAASNAGELERAGNVRVVGVVDGDTVTIAAEPGTPSEIRLVGIQAPKLPLGRAGFRKWPFADEAKRALEELTLNRELIMSHGGRKRDRHGRWLGHLHLPDGTWVQGEMLERGLARVYSFADNRALVGEMLALERAARQAGRGIWSHPFYRIRRDTEAARDIGSFQLVEGTVRDVALVRGRAYLNFGDNWRTDFTVTLAPKTVRLFAGESIDLQGFGDKVIRVRGWLTSYNGPMIAVTHPEQIEVLRR